MPAEVLSDRRFRLPAGERVGIRTAPAKGGNRRRNAVLSVVVALAVVPAAPASAQATYPDAPKRPVSDTYSGTSGPVKVGEDYRWLENLDDPAVKDWVTAQNAAQFLGMIATVVFWPRLLHGGWSLTDEETRRTVDEAARTIAARYGVTAPPSASSH